ncbi:hypothetical protein Chelonae_p0078 [[Mycobacterium] chelonae subsp. bovistauri]|nr:hypothetical protein Chelonae_p0078 [Mycobacterium sp. QIA-37]
MNSMPTDVAWPGSERRDWPTSVSGKRSALPGVVVAAADARTAVPQWRGLMTSSIRCPQSMIFGPARSVSTAVDQQRLQNRPIKSIAVRVASSAVHRSVDVR